MIQNYMKAIFTCNATILMLKITFINCYKLLQIIAFKWAKFKAHGNLKKKKTTQLFAMNSLLFKCK